MKRRHHQLRRARFTAMTLVAVVLIALAVAMGLVQVLLPLMTRYPDFVARQLSARLHQPVSFKSLSSEWQPSGPLLVMTDLKLGPRQPGEPPLVLPHAALKFDLGAWLRPNHRWITLRLGDMDLRIEHSTSGWHVIGFSRTPVDPMTALRALPVDLDLRNLRVEIVDVPGGHSWRLLVPHARMVRAGDAVRFGAMVTQLGTHQTVTLNGKIDTVTRDAAFHAATRGMDFADALRGLDLRGYAVPSGRGDLDLWADWSGGKLASAALRYDLSDFRVAGPDGRVVDAPRLGGTLQAKRADGGWDLAWRGPGKPGATIDQAGGALVHLRGHSGAWQVSAAAHAVEVAPWLPVLAMLPQLPESVAAWVTQAQPRARIESAAFVRDGAGRLDATVHLSGLHATAAGKAPGLDLARATLRADEHALLVELPAQPAVVALTHVFRKPFTFEQLQGDLVAWREDGKWNVAADDLRFETGELAGSGHAHMVWLGDGHRPFLSAYATVDHARVGNATQFWPYRHMKPQLIEWLDRALVDGDVTSGSVLIRGNLDDWPFLHNEGRFEATGTVSNATFDFHEDWPRATKVDAALDFVDNQMRIVATHADVLGVTVTHAEATIPDLRHGVLGLAVQGNGSGADMLEFVRHSPVGADAIDVLDGITVGGTGKFDIHMSIPLDDVAGFTLGGKVDLAKADVTADKWNLALKGVTGPLVIDGKGFRAQDLTTTFRGAPATLSLAVGSGVADPKNIVEGSLDVTTSVQNLATGYPDLDPLVVNASGEAPFHVGVRVVSGTDGAAATPILTVQSSLKGVALDFPAPLDKPAASTLPLDFTLQLPPAGAPLTVSLGDVLRVRGRLADASHGQATALAVNFGSTAPTAVPAHGLEVGGHAARLDLSGWIQRATGAGSGGAFPPLVRAHVGMDHAEVFGTDLGPLKFDYVAGVQANKVSVAGPSITGTLQLPVADLMTHGITADFEHLRLPEEETAPESSEPATPPTGVSLVAPTAVPPLHVTIRNLELGKLRLGAVVFESAPFALGMHVSRFESTGKDFTIKAQGDWNGTRDASQSHFVIDIASQDLGRMLSASGFSELLEGGKDSHIHLDATWPGPPSSLSLAWMTGTLAIEVGEGSILSVQPGLGRLLGLLSLKELPSRLMLHFGDVFKPGFGFDHATATFELRDGSAYTRDMVIAAPAANIAVQGRIGFRARDYDLTVDVTPHVGVALPVVGAVLGGPIGAAAGLVVQGLVGKGINEAAGHTYRVSGGWDKPQVTSTATPAAEQSDADPAQAPPAAAASGGPASSATEGSAPPSTPPRTPVSAATSGAGTGA